VLSLVELRPTVVDARIFLDAFGSEADLTSNAGLVLNKKERTAVEEAGLLDEGGRLLKYYNDTNEELLLEQA
jgi:hypothetical protein